MRALRRRRTRSIASQHRRVAGIWQESCGADIAPRTGKNGAYCCFGAVVVAARLSAATLGFSAAPSGFGLAFALGFGAAAAATAGLVAAATAGLAAGFVTGFVAGLAPGIAVSGSGSALAGAV